MTQSYWPFDGIDTTETQYSQLFRRMSMTGVWGDPSTTDCKLIAASGLNTTLKAGYAFVRGHMYKNDADVTVTFTAGGAAARTDLLVLRLDPTANTILPVIIVGNPADYAAAPGYDASGNWIPQATDAGQYDLLIAAINTGVSDSVINSGDIVDARYFAQHVFGMWSTAQRPKTPRIGQPGFNYTTGKPEFWDGATWQPFSAASITASQISDPGNLTAGNSLKIGGHTVFVQSATPTGMAANDLWFW